MAKRKQEPNGAATAVAEAPKKRGRPPKQPMLNDDPAFERLKDIETAALEYADLRDRRQALLADEVDSKERLKTRLKKHNLTEYSFDGYMVSLVVEEETVKVRKKRAAKEDGSLA